MIKHYACLYDTEGNAFHVGEVFSPMMLTIGSRFFAKGDTFEVFEVDRNFNNDPLIDAKAMRGFMNIKPSQPRKWLRISNAWFWYSLAIAVAGSVVSIVALECIKHS